MINNILQEYSKMFKKRKNEKKTNIAKDLEDIAQEEGEEGKQELPKSFLSKKINKFSNKISKNTEETPNSPKQKPIIKYGLIDKQQVDSKHHANLQVVSQKKAQPNSLMSLYVKKKMQEMHKTGNTDNKQQNTVSEILNLQKKYLQHEKQKLAQYDIIEIQKKLQNTANNLIRGQLNARTYYLKDLLENQHERMEYASKKELKTLKQQKERLERNFQNKYNDHGRRSYVEQLKHSSLVNK